MKRIVLFFMCFLVFLLTVNANVFAHEKEAFESFKEASRDFIKNGDGTYTDVYYPNVVNYYDGTEYKRIDNSFIVADSGYTNKSSNYKIEVPKKLNKENSIKLDYYSNEMLFKFLTINDEMNSQIEKKISNDKRYTETSLSEKIIYSNNKYKITADNYTNNLKIKIEFNSVTDLNDFKIKAYSNNLIFKKNNDLITVLNENKMVIFEINTNYTLKINDSIYREKLDIDGNGILTFGNDFLAKESKASVEMQVLYTINNSNTCITDKYITSGIDYSYDTEYMKVGTSGTNEYKAIIGINLSVFSTKLYVYEANLVYYKESGSNKTLKIYKINNEMYGDITGLTSYTKTVVDSADYTNGYHFNITNVFHNQVIEENDRYVFEISLDPNQSGTVWLASDDAYDMPYLELDYEDIAGSDYGAALPYQFVGDINVNCFGYALNVNQYLDLINQNGIDVFPNSSLNITEEDVEVIYVPVVMYVTQSLGKSIRLIDDYNSPIFEDEYRIAFRVGNLYNVDISTSDFHFLRQNNNGTWSHKVGESGSNTLVNTYNPNKWSWNKFLFTLNNTTQENISYYYDSKIYYFAVGAF